MNAGGSMAAGPVGNGRQKPHIYRGDGVWWCDGKGRRAARGGRISIPLSRPTFPEVCHLAQLAAIYSGAWRRA